MSIPKVIHYCWFGGNPLPKSAEKCIKSWQKYCPDYEIKRWDESNFDVTCNEYCKFCYENKKWAFLTDYIRLKVVYDNGGVYLDTDVELLKPLDKLLENGAYMGFENETEIATGLGFAGEAGHPFIGENMRYYEELSDLSHLRPCPQITTELLIPYGLKEDDGTIQNVAGINIYPPEYLCPKNERTGLTEKTKNTYSIHHFDASWFEKSWKEGQKKRWRRERIRYIVHIPNMILMKLLGDKNYAKLKALLKRG
jgi:hypothetical protein